MLKKGKRENQIKVKEQHAFYFIRLTFRRNNISLSSL